MSYQNPRTYHYQYQTSDQLRAFFELRAEDISYIDASERDDKSRNSDYRSSLKYIKVRGERKSDSDRQSVDACRNRHHQQLLDVE